MSAQIAKVMVPGPVAMPRGAELAARVSESLLRLGNRTWRALEAVGQARARRELQRLAQKRTDRTEVARLLREAAQRAAMSRD